MKVPLTTALTELLPLPELGEAVFYHQSVMSKEQVLSWRPPLRSYSPQLLLDFYHHQGSGQQNSVISLLNDTNKFTLNGKVSKHNIGKNDVSKGQKQQSN